MQEPNKFEQLRGKYADEDRAKLIMLQLRTLMEQKKKKKWLRFYTSRPKTSPKSWQE